MGFRVSLRSVSLSLSLSLSLFSLSLSLCGWEGGGSVVRVETLKVSLTGFRRGLYSI